MFEWNAKLVFRYMDSVLCEMMNEFILFYLSSSPQFRVIQNKNRAKLYFFSSKYVMLVFVNKRRKKKKTVKYLIKMKTEKS